MSEITNYKITTIFAHMKIFKRGIRPIPIFYRQTESCPLPSAPGFATVDNKSADAHLALRTSMPAAKTANLSDNTTARVAESYALVMTGKKFTTNCSNALKQPSAHTEKQAPKSLTGAHCKQAENCAMRTFFNDVFLTIIRKFSEKRPVLNDQQCAAMKKNSLFSHFFYRSGKIGQILLRIGRNFHNIGPCENNIGGNFNNIRPCFNNIKGCFCQNLTKKRGKPSGSPLL